MAKGHSDKLASGLGLGGLGSEVRRGEYRDVWRQQIEAKMPPPPPLGVVVGVRARPLYDITF